MPKIDIAAIAVRQDCPYPKPFDAPCPGRTRRRPGDGETILRAGDAATFPKGTGNGHHLINRSSKTATYLEVGSRQMEDLTTCSDIDMKSANLDGRFVHKDGTPY